MMENIFTKTVFLQFILRQVILERVVLPGSCLGWELSKRRLPKMVIIWEALVHGVNIWGTIGRVAIIPETIVLSPFDSDTLGEKTDELQISLEIWVRRKY